MMPWFTWKNKNSLNDFGLWIKSLPKRVKAAERNEEVVIPGRAGSVVLLEGEDVFNSYSAEMVIVASDDINIDKAVEWLRGSGDLVLCNDAEKARECRIVGEVAFIRVNNCWMEATVPLVCQPFRKSITEDSVTITGSSGSMSNPGDVASKPLVTISGGGNNTITIAGQAMSFTGVSTDTIVVDCDAQIITKGNNIWTGTFSGDFWKLPKGAISIAQTSNASITINPRWRWM